MHIVTYTKQLHTTDGHIVNVKLTYRHFRKTSVPYNCVVEVVMKEDIDSIDKTSFFLCELVNGLHHYDNGEAGVDLVNSACNKRLTLFANDYISCIHEKFLPMLGGLIESSSDLLPTDVVKYSFLKQKNEYNERFEKLTYIPV